MKRIVGIVGQVLTLGAYDSWQKLPAREKIFLPLAYFGGLAAYWWLSGAIR